MEIPNKQAFSKNLYQTLRQTKLLPPLPETAHELLRLRNNPDANLQQLTRLIEKDPSLTALIMKYARMAVHGYSDRITSVHSAITLVLGYYLPTNYLTCKKLTHRHEKNDYLLGHKASKPVIHHMRLVLSITANHSVMVATVEHHLKAWCLLQ